MNSQIIVVAAIIQDGEKILITQRLSNPQDLQPNLWEFPGGKVEFGESPENSLIREIKEELDLEMEIHGLYSIVSDVFKRNDDIIHAIMITYLCRPITTKVSLNSHQAYLWVTKEELANYDWAKLDVPVVTKILENN